MASKELNYEELSSERKKYQKMKFLPEWYTTQSWQLFKARYMVEGECALLGRYRAISKRLARHMGKKLKDEWEENFFNILWEGILSPASPIVSNTATNRGMIVSCSGQYIENSIDSIFANRHTAAMLSKYSFGCSGYFGDIQARGTISDSGVKVSGTVPWLLGFREDSCDVTQGSVRRGSFSGYLPISHPDFYEWMEHLEHEPDGLHPGFNWYDKDTISILQKDPEISKRLELLEYVKCLNGKGYMFFPDKVNRARPQMYKDLGLDVVASNMCTEIELHSSPKFDFSCVLSSLNLIHWDKIKANPRLIFIAMVFLDCVVSEFLSQSKDKPGLEKIRNFTKLGRPVGLGVMGFQSYLHDKMIPYESIEAQLLNYEIFKLIHDETLKASKWLAEEFGEPEWCKGYGVRNTHRTALAPTKSSSILMGMVSEQTFPFPAMIFESSSAAGGIPRIVSKVYQLMNERGVFNTKTIENINNNLGSIQHVDWLDDHEKLVLKTGFEIDQEVIRQRASQRQPFLCQGQSLNFYIGGSGNEKTVKDLITRCILDENIHSAYYFYSRSGVIVSNGACTNCEA